MLTSLAGGAILGERFGDGPVDVIALHGWGRTGHDFSPVLEGTNAVAVHLPGFGPAPAPDSAWAPADYASWLSQGIDPGRPAVIVGHSFGGRVAIKLAVSHPELVSSLVLTGVPFGGSRPRGRAPWRLRLAKALHARGVVSDTRVEALRQRFGSADYRAAEGVMRDILVKAVNDNYGEDLPRITHPVTLVWGEKDTPAPLDSAVRAHDILPRSTLVVVPDSAHLLDNELHQALREAIGVALVEMNRKGEG